MYKCLWWTAIMQTLNTDPIRNNFIPINSNNVHFHLLPIDTKSITFNHYDSLGYNSREYRLF